jgi:hypothetical protein
VNFLTIISLAKVESAKIGCRFHLEVSSSEVERW